MVPKVIHGTQKVRIVETLCSIRHPVLFKSASFNSLVKKIAYCQFPPFLQSRVTRSLLHITPWAQTGFKFISPQRVIWGNIECQTYNLCLCIIIICLTGNIAFGVGGYKKQGSGSLLMKISGRREQGAKNKRWANHQGSGDGGNN